MFKIHFDFLETFKNFFSTFCAYDETGNKCFKYAIQLQNIAHREQVPFVIDLDDLHEHDDKLATALTQNARRYVNLVADVVSEMLPDYKQREVPPKDALDVYIRHRLLLERRNQQPGEQRNPNNKYPPELLRRL